jgi:hypothetical protein
MLVGAGQLSWFSDYATGMDVRLILFCFKPSKPAVASEQPPVQWVMRQASTGVKSPGRQPDHSPGSGG